MQNDEITSVVSLDELMANPELHSLDLTSEAFRAAATEMAKTNDVEDPAPSDEPEEVENEPADEDEKVEQTDEPKKKRGVEKRIDKLVAEKRELERRLAALETKPEPEPVNAPQGKPKLDDYDTLEEFTEALTDWKLDQREIKKTEELKQKETAATWETRAAAAKTKFNDFDDYVNVETLNSSNASREALIFLGDSEVGPEVVYTLLKDDDALESFMEASPVQQVKILTKLEMSLSQEPKSQKPAASTAPPPPKKLAASTKTFTGRDLIQHAGEMSDAEWLRLADEYSRNKRKK